MRMSHLYALTDPRSPGDIRYIGVTRNAPSTRLRQHISSHRKPRTPVAHWIGRLVADGVEPEMYLLASGDESWDVYAAEVATIAAYAASGRLLNVTPGGRGGGVGPKSPEHAEAISRALKGRKAPERTPEWREAHAAKMRGRKHSPETLVRMAEAAKRRWAEGRGARPYERTPEHRQRMSEVQRAMGAS